MRRYYYTIIICVFLLGCKENKEIDFSNKGRLIIGELMTIDSLIGKPYELCFIDSFLFIIDRYEGKMVTIVDVENNNKVVRNLNEGRGPGEVSGPLRVSISIKKKEIQVFQIQSGIMNVYDLTTRASNNDFKLVRSISFSDRPANAVLTRECAIGIGPFSEGRYHLYDLNGVFKIGVGDYPFNGNRMNPMDRFILYQGYLQEQPDGDFFALGSSYSDNLEFYKLEKSGITLVNRYGIKDVMGTYDNSIQLNDNCLMGFKGSYGTEKYCYMLYSGKTLKENNNRRMWGTRIFVFNWNGELIQTYELNQEVISFCVDEIKGLIYGIVNMEGNFEIMKFKS